MSLDGNRLGTAIFNAVKAINIPQDTQITDATLEDIWQALGNSIVTEFKNNALIATSGTAVGVTPGGASVPTSASGSIT